MSKPKQQEKANSSRPSEVELVLNRPGSAQMTSLDLSDYNITSLAAFQVSISSLRRLKQIDISKNSISSLKYIRSLPILETVICSNNAMTTLVGLEECPMVQTVDASDNAITVIGDLRHLSRLKNLDIHGNSMSSISSLPHNLPGSLSTLNISNNELGSLSDLRYVSSLMELRRLDLRANPITSAIYMKGIDHRPFVVFLLPRLSTLDDKPVSRQEWAVSRTLFCEEPGILSDALMALLQPANEKRLRQYLMEKCSMAVHEPSQHALTAHDANIDEELESRSRPSGFRAQKRDDGAVVETLQSHSSKGFSDRAGASSHARIPFAMDGVGLLALESENGEAGFLKKAGYERRERSMDAMARHWDFHLAKDLTQINSTTFSPRCLRSEASGRRKELSGARPSALRADSLLDGSWEIHALKSQIQMLTQQLEEERNARSRQDEALRILWNEVGRLRGKDEHKAAIKIQKCWRGHDDRELFRIAMDHYTRFKLERSAAVVKLQRWARRVFWRSFGTLFRMQDTATRCLQRVVRGHRSRRKMEGLLGNNSLKQEIRYIRDVEIVRLQRTLSAVQDTMDHVLSILGPAIGGYGVREDEES
ncbi:hypothetical protein GUITHDRAFT_108869 [Guillardia theta CCMP2712]|uniref:Uncharacterized protein n=1 Tax=Guillardia theta (strain CCMP2712) TaxID=905079 RepID=L1JAV6_GUITC|nr:hypothetical protein GUITHDRAFT_108869 [Guillardia theta CCMP2712]EKX45229.1 hypothetical protein GUITHDRAFT_108869 [Guillardia theta CCMP2712]|eukprot:XP_005832209.1 hypothetical protein GUITHDRAFT_108869 [Guillardia theta CCMP2712]